LECGDPLLVENPPSIETKTFALPALHVEAQAE
jgi:hypothetical protein